MPELPAATIEIGRDGGSLRGVAGDGVMTFAAVTVTLTAPAAATATAPKTVIEARRGAQVAWTAELAGAGGPLVRTGDLLAAVVNGTGEAAGVPLRGSPGAVLVGLDAPTGAGRWKLALDSSEWATVAAVAPADRGGVLVGGSFAGTLRIGAKVVSSGGRSDGFVARISATGEVELLVRLGGPGADAVQGIAGARDRIAIAGTFAAGADLLGTPLEAVDPRVPYADAFVAELDPATGKPRWTAVYGGKLDDAVAGVAIDLRGRVVVAGTARDVVHVNGRDLIAQGPADALVAWWERDGAAGPAVLVGGAGFDGAAAIAAAGERVVVGGFFAGALRAGTHALTAVAGDDALLVALDNGAVVDAWPAGGEGREEIAALAGVPGGFVAGLAHTAGARVGAERLRAPSDGTSGAAIVVRPVR
jgi:hypothetical protein